MRYELVIRLTAGDVGRRVVIRWRRPAQAAPETSTTGQATDASTDDSADGQVTDVLGILEAADEHAFAVRKASGEVVVIPRDRALAGKVIPPASRQRHASVANFTSAPPAD
jgi:hypothetical protein